MAIGLTDSNQIRYPLVVRSGINDKGKTIRYLLNYSGKEQSVTYNFNNGNDLLLGKPIKKDASISIKPWDVVIVEE